MTIKRFAEWIGLKAKLHCNVHRPPHVSEGDIWWASLGENVGYEINGKSTLFSRPVIILRKLSHGFFFVIPTTTQNRHGSWFVSFYQQNRRMAACLHQARSIDYRRLSNKLGELDAEDLKQVRKGFQNLVA